MKKKKELIARLKGWILNMLTVVIPGGIIVYLIISHGGLFLGVATMMHEFLNTPIDTLWAVLPIALFLWAIILFARYSLITIPNRLLKQIGLSRPIATYISIEEKGNPTIETVYGIFPHLHFNMRVINRTYYSFEPEEATIQCSCGSDPVFKPITWNKNIKTPDEATYILVEKKLLQCDDCSIGCHVPIKEMYDNLGEWKLSGNIKYKVDVNKLTIKCLQLEDDVDLRIDLKYNLPEEEQMKLKQEIENALKANKGENGVKK